MEKVDEQLRHQAALDAAQLEEMKKLLATHERDLEILNKRVEELEQQVLLERRIEAELEDKLTVSISEVDAYRNLVAEMEKVADKLKQQAALDAAQLEEVEGLEAIHKRDLEVLSEQIVELEQQVLRERKIEADLKNRLTVLEGEKEKLSLSQLAAADAHLREQIDMNTRLAKMEGETVVLKQRVALSDELEAQSSTELDEARAHAHLLSCSLQKGESELEGLRQELSDLKKKGAQSEEVGRENEARLALNLAVLVALSADATNLVQELEQQHAVAEKWWMEREGLLRNLVVNAEVEIKRLGQELYGESFEYLPLMHTAGAQEHHLLLATNPSSVPLSTPTQMTSTTLTRSTTEHAQRISPADMKKRGISDLLDRLMHLEGALLEISQVTFTLAERDKICRHEGAQQTFTLTDRTAESIAVAAELVGFREKIQLMEEERVELLRKLAAKEAMRKKLETAEKRIQLLAGEVLALERDRDERKRSLMVMGGGNFRNSLSHSGRTSTPS